MSYKNLYKMMASVHGPYRLIGKDIHTGKPIDWKIPAVVQSTDEEIAHDLHLLSKSAKDGRRSRFSKYNCLYCQSALNNTKSSCSQCGAPRHSK